VSAGARTFPGDRDAALALPGIGEYTAAAVLSIAYALPYAAVDGNVVRVVSRLGRLATRDAAAGLAVDLLDRRRPGDWNQALMELGQTICLPRSQRCPACPVAIHCTARAHGEVDRYPPPRPRRASERLRLRMTVLTDPQERLLLQRGAFAHLPHLWLPPLRVSRNGRPAPHPAAFRHTILHRIFDVEIERVVLSAQALDARARAPKRGFECAVFERGDLARIGRSALLTKALRFLPAAEITPRAAASSRDSCLRPVSASRSRRAPGRARASSA
jgi:A/G-specific adenine glycosylase